VIIEIAFKIISVVIQVKSGAREKFFGEEAVVAAVMFGCARGPKMAGIHLERCKPRDNRLGSANRRRQMKQPRKQPHHSLIPFGTITRDSIEDVVVDLYAVHVPLPQ
jgi:hypothetical protein